jgi:hypothetical protein
LTVAKKKKEDETPEEPLDPVVPEEEPAEAISEPVPELVPDRKKTILVDYYANGQYVRVEVPENWFFDRRISLKRKELRGTAETGFKEVEVVVNLEHCDDDTVTGEWKYRQMA